MRGNFEACLDATLKHEGGWADHPKDPGGATMRGVTLDTYRRYYPGASKADLRAISEADLRRIYREGYWDAVRGDDLPAGLDLVAFDGAVNSGPARGAKWLQSAVGVRADGRIGAATIAAANVADAQSAIRAACQSRMAFLRGLKTWPTFGRGWAGRVTDIERAALEMAGAKPSARPAQTSAGWLAAILAIIVKLLRGSK